MVGPHMDMGHHTVAKTVTHTSNPPWHLKIEDTSNMFWVLSKPWKSWALSTVRQVEAVNIYGPKASSTLWVYDQSLLHGILDLL